MPTLEKDASQGVNCLLHEISSLGWWIIDYQCRSIEILGRKTVRPLVPCRG